MRGLSEKLIEKAKKIFGITDSCKFSTFILPEGKALDIVKDTSTLVDYHPHNRAAKKVLGDVSGWDATEKFIDSTGSIRYVPMRSHINIQLGLKNPLTKKQLEFIEQCTCFRKPVKSIVYDFVVDEKIVRASGTYDEDDCFKGIDKLKKDFNKYLAIELEKHWEDTKEEREKTHTSRLLEKKYGGR